MTTLVEGPREEQVRARNERAAMVRADSDEM